MHWLPVCVCNWDGTGSIVSGSILIFRSPVGSAVCLEQIRVLEFSTVIYKRFGSSKSCHILILPTIQGSLANSCSFDHGTNSRQKLLVHRVEDNNACLCKWWLCRLMMKFGDLYITSEAVIYVPSWFAIVSAISFEIRWSGALYVCVGFAITAYRQRVSETLNADIFVPKNVGAKMIIIENENLYLDYFLVSPWPLLTHG